MKVSYHTTYNIQGVKQHNPSMLHDTVEAVEGGSGVDEAEWVSCDEALKSKLYQGEGALLSISTSSNNASSCRDACNVRGECRRGV